MPDFNTSILSFSSFPLGTSEWGTLGIFDKMFSNSILTNFCLSDTFSNSDEISLDFLNSLSSLDFEISFFSFSKAYYF